MTTFTKTAALALLVLGVGTATADDVSAAGKYAVAKVTNPLTTTVSYRYRWGTGAWKVTSLSPGTTNRHSWRYQFEGQNASPKLQIRFDADQGEGVFFRTYTLQKHSVPYRTIGGKDYRFKYSNVIKGILRLSAMN